MMFSFCISILGFAFAIRTSEFLIARAMFTRSEMTKIGTAYIASVFLLAIVVPRTRCAMWFAAIAPLFPFAIIIYVCLQNRSESLKRVVRESLSVMLLKMKSGRSFRQSLNDVTNDCDSRWRSKFSEIASVVVFSQQKTGTHGDHFVAEVIEELTLIDRQPHAAARRLRVFRDKLKIEDDLRRKSGQILSRVRAQSFVMSGLYLAVLVFMVLKFGWSVNAELLVISIALFAIGTLWMWVGGKKKRWKV